MVWVSSLIIRSTIIAFFIGRKVYLFDDTQLLKPYPKPLTDFDLPETLTHIDADFGLNNNNYLLISGTKFWRFNGEENRVKLGYPCDMIEIWQKFSKIEAKFQIRDGSIIYQYCMRECTQNKWSFHYSPTS